MSSVIHAAAHLFRQVSRGREDLRGARSNPLLMRRFLITSMIATALHTIACILVPPYEWGTTRLECFFYAFRSGLISFPILFAVLLLPLRAGLRRVIPHNQRTHAVAAGLVLMSLVAAMILPGQLAGLPVKPYQHSYLSKWVFWSVLVDSHWLTSPCPGASLATCSRWLARSPFQSAFSSSHEYGGYCTQRMGASRSGQWQFERQRAAGSHR